MILLLALPNCHAIPTPAKHKLRAFGMRIVLKSITAIAKSSTTRIKLKTTT